MPVSRERKQELVASYVDTLKDCDGFIIVKTQGLSVSQIQGLRNTIREQNGQYIVAKNTLMRKALETANWIVPDDSAGRSRCDHLRARQYARCFQSFAEAYR